MIHYNLEIKEPINKNINKMDIIDKLEQSYINVYHTVDKYGNLNVEVEWDNESMHLKNFSKKYPECVFILSGIENKHFTDSTTIRRSYFKNGMSYQETVNTLFKGFDEKKLK